MYYTTAKWPPYAEADIVLVDGEEDPQGTDYVYASCYCTLIGEALRIDRAPYSGIVQCECPRCHRHFVTDITGGMCL